jgi:large subunit ribosomal protein L29
VKAEELRTLDSDELESRLKGARRELYELRFKLAVGQLDNHRQIRQVRKDIARIMTVAGLRQLEEEEETDRLAVAPEEGEAPTAEPAAEEAAATATPQQVEDAASDQAAEAEPAEATPAGPEDESPTPARRRRRTRGEENQ